MKINKKKAIWITVAVFFVLTSSIAAILYYQYNKMLDEISEAEKIEKIDEEKQIKKEAKEELKPFTLMMLGVDSRGEEASRSDTIMLAAVNPQKEAVLLVSIPRDTYAEVPDHGKTKINHSMFLGGPPLVADSIEELIGVPVDHYVTIDFEGFRRVIDELGGVTINVDRRMKYSDPTDGTKIDLQPGEQVLNGEQALGFARFRKSNTGAADSDFLRIERQHEVIKAIIDKGKGVSNIFKVFSFMDIMGTHIKTDLYKSDINDLIRIYKDFSSDALQTDAINGKGARREIDGYNLWVLIVEDEEKQRVKERIENFLAGNITPPAIEGIDNSMDDQAGSDAQ